MGNPHLGFTPQAQSHAETCYCMNDIPVIIHMYLWSVQVHVVRGTDFPQTLTPKPPCGDLSGIDLYYNQRCWLDTNSVGQCTLPPLYLRLTVGGARFGLGHWLGCRPVIQQLVFAWVRIPSPGHHGHSVFLQ